MKDISYPDLCSRFVTGNVSKDEEKFFNKWLDESELNPERI